MNKLVCYCFNHTAEDIERDVVENARSVIAEQIMTESKDGNCNCKTNNPKQHGCLADVRQVVDKAMQKHGITTKAGLTSL